MIQTALTAEGLCKSFSGVPALDDVTITIGAREVVGVVGENGAGKSTLIKALGGLSSPDHGRITVRGKPVTLRNAHEAAEAGIGIVHQELSLLPNVSVAENILLGHEDRATRVGFYDWGAFNALAAAQLAKLGSRIQPSTPTDSLSMNDRQVIEVAKVLAIEERTSCEPIILLDEPTAMQVADGREAVLSLIERLRERASVLFVSHRLDEVIRVSQRIYVLRKGCCVAECRRGECDVAELQRFMLGHALGGLASPRTKAVSPDAARLRLSVRGLSRRDCYRAVNFDLRAGEILALAGWQMSGHESLCRTLFGAERADGGEILLDGRPIRLREPADAVKAGIGYVPAERNAEGIIAGLTVLENMTLPHLGEFRWGLFLDRRRERGEVMRMIDRLHIRPSTPEAPVHHLSGGNQQKVALAKWLIGRALKVLILDHPFRGLDVGAKAELFTVIHALASSDTGILLTDDAPEDLVALGDAILVMRDGVVAGYFPASEPKPSPRQILERMG